MSEKKLTRAGIDKSLLREVGSVENVVIFLELYIWNAQKLFSLYGSKNFKTKKFKWDCYSTCSRLSPFICTRMGFKKTPAIFRLVNYPRLTKRMLNRKFILLGADQIKKKKELAQSSFFLLGREKREARKKNQPKCPPMPKWMKKTQYIHPTEYFPSIKAGKILSCATMSIDLADTTLNKRSQAKKDEKNTCSLW